MRLIDDWKNTLVRSSAGWLGVAGGTLQAASMYLIIFQDAIDDSLLFAAALGCAGLGALCSYLVMPARVTKQKSISGGADARQ